MVSGPASDLSSSRNSLPARFEPTGATPSLRQRPGYIEIRLPSLDALLDRRSEPSYPHTSPTVERSVAKFLLDAAREQRGRGELSVNVVLAEAPLTPEAETEARTRMQHYFADEAELAALDLRVNRSEGLGSLRYALPVIAVALLVAGVFYTQLGGTSGESYLATLSYLVFITIVWLMLWDPLEVLLFDSYMIRLRAHAFQKLARASVTFTYRTTLGAGVGAEGVRSA